MTTANEPITLFSREERDPYPTYARLRAEAPVYQEPQFGSWVLSRYADVYGALRDYETYSSARGITPGEGFGGAMGALPLIMEDPPRHNQVRRIVNQAFRPSQIRALTPAIQELTDELLAGIDEDDFEAVEGLTVPLPVIVISRMLGIPEADREQFKRWSDAVTGVIDVGPDRSWDDFIAERQAAVSEMLVYLTQTIAQRRQTPGPDVISLLQAAEIDGERMTDLQLLGFAVLLLIAGNETTTNLIGNVLNVLADRPDLWQRLRADRSLVGGVVEESLRFDSPVQMLWRTTTRPVELHGQRIPEGDKVMVLFASANRDAEEFPDADTFNPERDWASHVAFGYGTHYCLGSPLARVEARVALEALLDRYARLERGEGAARRVPSAVLRGFAALPLSLTPA